MAYIRKRTTKAGSVSTTLVESYRDEMGRPRQRVLANLHGEPDLTRALAKLVTLHELLLKQRSGEHVEPSGNGEGFVLVTDRALTEYNHHIVQIDRRLAAIERDTVVINEHCAANDDELLEAMQLYKEEYCKAFEQSMGLAIARKQADAAYGEWRNKLT